LDRGDAVEGEGKASFEEAVDETGRWRGKRSRFLICFRRQRETDVFAGDSIATFEELESGRRVAQVL